MKRGLLVAGLCWASMGVIGCGGGDAPKDDKKDETKSAAVQPAEKTLDIGPDSTPDQVVVGLIEAMKSGDKVSKEALLTTKAREETAKHNMPVHTMAMPNTQYQVGKPKYLERNPNGAHVSSILTETFEDGSTQDHQIVWVLRKEQENGWRIAGMAVELLPGTPPQYLNFEDPLDMQKKMDEAAAAMVEQERQAMATQAGANEEERQAQIPNTLRESKIEQR